MPDRPIEGNDFTQMFDILGQLKGIVEEQLASIHDRLEHLTEVVREAVEELGVLRNIEDEKASDVQWAVRNGRPIFQRTSMSIDPTAPDAFQLSDADRRLIESAPALLEACGLHEAINDYIESSDLGDDTAHPLWPVVERLRLACDQAYGRDGRT